jgi:UDP-N-acetylmuramate--alanine ligase
VCVFQPHQARRLQALFKEFVDAFHEADILLLIPSYQVAGRDTENSKFTAEYLAHEISKKYPKKKVYYLAEPERIKRVIKEILVAQQIAQETVIIMMGAGNIVNYTPRLY